MSFFKELDYDKFTSNKPKKVKRDRQKNTSAMAQKLIKVVEGNPFVTNKELSVLLGKSVAQTKRYLKNLTDSGIITSELKYNSFAQEGELKISTSRTLHTCNTKKSSQ